MGGDVLAAAPAVALQAVLPRVGAPLLFSPPILRGIVRAFAAEAAFAPEIRRRLKLF